MVQTVSHKNIIKSICVFVNLARILGLLEYNFVSTSELFCGWLSKYKVFTWASGENANYSNLVVFSPKSENDMSAL